MQSMRYGRRCLGIGARCLQTLLCVLGIIVGVNEVVQHTRMVRMARVNVLEKLGGLTTELLKSRKSLRQRALSDAMAAAHDKYPDDGAPSIDNP